MIPQYSVGKKYDRGDKRLYFIGNTLVFLSKTESFYYSVSVEKMVKVLTNVSDVLNKIFLFMRP